VRHLAQLACLVGCLLAAPSTVHGQVSDGILADRLLSDDEFFRLATCGATPGGPCTGPAPRWDKPTLRLALMTDGMELPDGFVPRLDAAIIAALDQINGVHAGITITQVLAPPADITIRPTALAEGTDMATVPGSNISGFLGIGFMTLWWDDREAITRAEILISTAITDADLPSAMLEEITQALGFLHDIDGPAYEGVSILSQTSNATTTIAGQDAALLRWFYPPQD
jgi:hypothetical protein